MGLDVLRWLGEREEFDATIVLVLTSSQQPEDMRAAYRLHANGYVVKPSGLGKLHLLAQSIRIFG